MALAAFNLAALAVYESATYRLFFHSDAAVKNLLAEEVLRSGSLFPSDWVWVNGDLLVVYGHLLIVPLIALFPNGFALHAFSCSVVAALFLALSWWVTGLFRLSSPVRWPGLAVVASGVSPYVSESWYGQASYGPLVAMMLLQGGLTLVMARALSREPGREFFGAALLLGLSNILLFLSNPTRAAGLVLYAASAAIGCFLYLVVAQRAHIVAGRTGSRLVSLEQARSNARLLGDSLLFLAGGAPDPDSSAPFEPGAGTILPIALVASVLAAGALPAFTREPAGGERRGGQALAWAFLAASGSTAFLYVFKSVAENVSSSRYLVPAGTLGLLSALFWLDGDGGRLRRWGPARIALAFVLAVTALSSARNYLVPLGRSLWTHGVTARAFEGPFDRLGRFLSDNGLSYGYASYWNANVVTVLSGGKVKVRSVEMGASPAPHLHLASLAWYGPEAHQGPTFLLMTKDEAASFDERQFERLAGPVVKRLSFEGKAIYVFDRNPAATTPGWIRGPG